MKNRQNNPELQGERKPLIDVGDFFANDEYDMELEEEEQQPQVKGIPWFHSKLSVILTGTQKENVSSQVAAAGEMPAGTNGEQAKSAALAETENQDDMDFKMDDEGQTQLNAVPQNGG